MLASYIENDSIKYYSQAPQGGKSAPSESRSFLLPSPLTENIKCELCVLGLFAQSELSSQRKSILENPVTPIEKTAGNCSKILLLQKWRLYE